MKRDFDKEAAAWDANPRRLRMTLAIAEEMRKELNLNGNQVLLDFGTGTGVVTLNLQPYVKKIIAVDSSAGMLAVLKEKLGSAGITNVEPMLWDIEQEPWQGEPVDIIVSSMTLHHLKDIERTIRTFYNMLVPNGQIALADLDPDNGEFHDDPTGVEHHGFDRNELEQIFLNTRFSTVVSRTVYTLRKPTKSGQEHDFTIFLLTALKEN